MQVKIQAITREVDEAEESVHEVDVPPDIRDAEEPEITTRQAVRWAANKIGSLNRSTGADLLLVRVVVTFEVCK